MLTVEWVGQPFTFSQQLHDACQWWLRAEEHDTEGIIDVMVLEKFITWLL